ncbi:MAG TPA: HEAT repeat domain-containing protein [Thermoanaerobaculia bacterium]|nr:HEAT repeat domain-containing protein [Thermoanaerobaculia bacterium]
MKRILIAVFLVVLALPLHADLRQQIESRSGWVGYSVPISGNRSICSHDDGFVVERASSMYVLYHVSNGAIDSIRVSSPQCRSDAPDQWLQNVDPRDSARLLRRLVDENGAVSRKAVTPLALQDGTVDDLIDIARHHSSARIRGTALFWVSQAAGDRAASVLKDAVENDPEEDVKARAVFGISQLPDDQSIPLLVDLLKTNRSREVRKKAAFWLGQKNDPRALAALEDILKQ